MNSAEVLTSICFGVPLLGIWWLVFFLLPEHFVARYRQRIFELRAELFDLAREGRIPFTHPAYSKLRDRMNGQIRFAHQPSLAKLLIFGLFSRLGKVELPSATKLPTEELDPSLRDRLQDLQEFAVLSAFGHALIRSPILILFGVPFLVVGLLWKLLSSLWHRQAPHIAGRVHELRDKRKRGRALSGIRPFNKAWRLANIDLDWT